VSPGLPPAPRLWLQWNMDELEPAGIKLREDMLKQGKGKKSSTVTAHCSHCQMLICSFSPTNNYLCK